MEPDQLKNLREKITTLEHQPVSWQKEFVWQQVSQKSVRRPLTIPWRYAAVLALTGIIGYFMFSYQQRNREVVALRIRSLEKQIESGEKKTVIDLTPKDEVCLEEKDNIILTVASSSKTKNPVLTEDHPVLEQKLLSINVSDSIITTMAILEPVASVEQSPQLKTIVPIMGKIPQSMTDLSRKERTVRIRLKKDPELRSSQEERHVLVARIN